MFRLEDLPARPATLWRYQEAFGTSPTVTMGEGWTPLVPYRERTYLKLDFVTPTGSYKDRGTSVMINKFIEWGVRELVEDSSGNAGASVAAYSAAAGLRASIFIPEGTSPGKAAQIAMYGAKLVAVPGSREDCTRAAMAEAERTFYGSHNWNPYFIAGLKTLAFEVAEQLEWQTPDWIVTPLGGGSLLLGLYFGFTEMLRAGIVKKMPRLAAVQAEQCAPVYYAWRAGVDDTPGVEKGRTIAEGISIARPVKGRDILEAVRASNGVVVTVNDGEIWRAVEALGRCGAYVEPTGAVAAAALPHLDTSPRDLVVLVLTGSGLKATDRIAARLSGAS